MARDETTAPGQPGQAVGSVPQSITDAQIHLCHLAGRLRLRLPKDALMTTLHLVLPGIPQQQGSKTRGANGASFEANKNLKPWRADAIAVCQANYKDQPITDAVLIEANFRYPRPQSHYGTGKNRGKLKDSAPFYKPTAPDLDKLQRAVGDALTQAGVIMDDRLIVSWSAWKTYTLGAGSTSLMVRSIP